MYPVYAYNVNCFRGRVCRLPHGASFKTNLREQEAYSKGIAFPLSFGFHAVRTCYPSVLLLLKDPCLGNVVNTTLLETLCKSQQTQVLS